MPVIYKDCQERVSQRDRPARMMLGLDIAEHHAQYGVPMSAHAIAAFCGCSPQAIRQVEAKVMKKLGWKARHLKAFLK